MKRSIFWDIMPCIPLKANLSFGGTCPLYLQGRRLSHARNQSESRAVFASYFHASFLLGIFFSREDGANIFHRNFGSLSTDYTALYSRGQNSSCAGSLLV
jgi:hypothetical protein